MADTNENVLKSDRKINYNQIYKERAETAEADNLVLSNRVKELIKQSEKLEDEKKELFVKNQFAKEEIEKLNQASREALLKKNIEKEQIQKLEEENKRLHQNTGDSNAKVLEIERLNDQKEAKDKVINDLNKKVESLNLLKTQVEDENKVLKNLKGSEAELKELKKVLAAKDEDLKNLKNEIQILNQDFEPLKLQSEKWQWRKKVFTVVVSTLASLANFTHLSDAYLSLIKEPDWLHKLTAYGSVLTFDLAILLFTLNSEKQNAKSFSLGVFTLCFFALSKPFEALTKVQNVSNYHTGAFWQSMFTGVILSAMFASIPYLNSQLFKKQ